MRCALELAGYWSARRGQYRVIYSIHDDQVLVRVVRISHRGRLPLTPRAGPAHVRPQGGG
jgi:hypothetical protein